jgi:ABC-type uncharacterized transport system involved in gliding motility auxiliary subunit
MKQILTTSGLLMAVAVLLAVNIISDTTLKSARLDLTENQLYTLSEGTQNILKNLEEPITLRFFFSQKLAPHLPSISTYTVRVKELLEEYQRAAGDNLKLMVIDPEPFSEQEDLAEGYGLQGVPVDEKNTMFYFGLAATNSVDDEETISFFSPNRAEFLEYDLTKLIYQLSNPKQKVVGIMSTLPIQGDSTASPFQQNAAQAWMVIEQIRQSFEVRTIETDAEQIPADIEVLMLVHPKDLSDATLYAIDQFVLKGGRAIIFADPYSEVYQPPANPQNPMAAMQAPRNSELSKLFDAWGIELEPNKVVGDLRTAQKVQVQAGQRVSVVNYPVWMDLDDKRYFNQESVITAKLGNITLATAGALVKKGEVETDLIPLIESGNQAMQIDTSKLGMFSQPKQLVRDFKPEGQFTLAALITGKVKTAFPDGKPKDEEQDSADKPTDDGSHITESVESINVIVVADTDMLEDKFWVRVQNFFGQRIPMPHAANATFVVNALDNLSGSNDLISVRNRGNYARTFTLVEDIQREAEQKYRDKEKELQTRLRETDQKIRELQRQKKQDGNELMLSVKQRQEIDRFRDKKIEIRKELRDVQHELHKNIEHLESWTKFINIGLMPLLIVIGGMTISFSSRRRRKEWQPV